MNPNTTAIWALWATVVGVVIGVITLGVVVFQVWLMRRQTKLMKRQIDIMNTQQDTMQEQTAAANRQLEIVQRQDELLNRRARLVVEASVEGQANGRIYIHFLARNTGNGSARNFYWHLYIPEEIASFRTVEHTGQSMNADGGGTFEGIPCRRFAEYHDKPLYPTRQSPLARIVLDPGEPGRGGFRFFWQVVAQDGMFPDQDQLGAGNVAPPTE